MMVLINLLLAPASSKKLYQNKLESQIAKKILGR